MNVRQGLQQRIDEARSSAAFGHYQRARDAVLAMLESTSSADRPSRYWEEELAGFDYLLDAPPLVVARLREHCHHVTGLLSLEYRGHHRRLASRYRAKLQRLRAEDRSSLFVGEHAALGGFGHDIDGARVNLDTLKFYECLIALDRAGLLGELRRASRPTVVEIGGGWGGLAYQLRSVCPGLRYVIVDLPQTMLFSATYLPTVFPDAKIAFVRDAAEADLRKRDADFTFVPHLHAKTFLVEPPALVINTVSFQEMTDEQVEDYARMAGRLGSQALYSFNRDRSPNNDELSAVSGILQRHFDLTPIEVLPDLQPTSLPDVGVSLASVLRGIKDRARRRLRGRSVFEYRHLVGRPRGEPSRTA